jgi:hypothetical protein
MQTKEDIVAYLQDKNIPADEITLSKVAQQILETPPEQGYLDYFQMLCNGDYNIQELSHY